MQGLKLTNRNILSARGGNLREKGSEAEKGSDVIPAEGSLDRLLGTKVSAAEKKNIIRLASSEMRMYQGPFPPAEEAKVYDSLCPGAFDRMLTMAEKANDSNIENNAKLVCHKAKIETTLAWLGWIALMILIVFLIGAAVLCALMGHDSVAIALGISASIPVIAGIIGKFIPAKPERRKQA